MDLNKATQLPLDREHAEQLFQKMLEISTVGIIFFDPNGDIVEANGAFLQMSGFDQEDVAAGRLRWDTLTPPEWVPPSLNAIQQFKDNGKHGSIREGILPQRWLQIPWTICSQRFE
jgi:PAS domain S-box-containing protein